MKKLITSISTLLCFSSVLNAMEKHDAMHDASDMIAAANTLPRLNPDRYALLKGAAQIAKEWSKDDDTTEHILSRMIEEFEAAELKICPAYQNIRLLLQRTSSKIEDVYSEVQDTFSEIHSLNNQLGIDCIFYEPHKDQGLIEDQLETLKAHFELIEESFERRLDRYEKMSEVLKKHIDKKSH